MIMRRLLCAAIALAGFVLSTEARQPAGESVAYVGARILDGTGAAPIENGVLVVRDGRIAAVGAAGTTTIPTATSRVDVSGKTIMPGMVNVHGHITNVRGMKGSAEFYTPEHIKHQLSLYARYGVTTVFSLGGDGPAGIEVRDQRVPGLARLFVAGPVVSAAEPEAARKAVDDVKAMKADLVKIRVDDNLGTATKMPVDAYRAVIDQAHKQGLKVAAHIFYLQDAREILTAGGDFIAHSVRDVPVDRAFIDLLKARNVCVCPTLMREVSTFVYESRPAFLDDSFFTRDADPVAVEGVQTPQHQAQNRTPAATRYKAALEMAKANLKQLSNAGVRIAMGTDSGPAARFQGYFEHLELEHMASAGLTPTQVIVASTSDAARCMGIADRVGTLRPGLAADFLVLARNPLEDIRHTRTLESAWVGGVRAAARPR
jgi:imidazolonepropionase-like amidohydrolase